VLPLTLAQNEAEVQIWQPGEILEEHEQQTTWIPTPVGYDLTKAREAVGLLARLWPVEEDDRPSPVDELALAVERLGWRRHYNPDEPRLLGKPLAAGAEGPTYGLVVRVELTAVGTAFDLKTARLEALDRVERQVAGQAKPDPEWLLGGFPGVEEACCLV
jgi:hypothetical protein